MSNLFQQDIAKKRKNTKKSLRKQKNYFLLVFLAVFLFGIAELEKAQELPLNNFFSKKNEYPRKYYLLDYNITQHICLDGAVFPHACNIFFPNT